MLDCFGNKWYTNINNIYKGKFYELEQSFNCRMVFKFRYGDIIAYQLDMYRGVFVDGIFLWFLVASC